MQKIFTFFIENKNTFFRPIFNNIFVTEQRGTPPPALQGRGCCRKLYRKKITDGFRDCVFDPFPLKWTSKISSKLNVCGNKLACFVNMQALAAEPKNEAAVHLAE